MQCLHSDLERNTQHYNESIKSYIQSQRLCRAVIIVLIGLMTEVDPILAVYSSLPRNLYKNTMYILVLLKLQVS